MEPTKIPPPTDNKVSEERTNLKKEIGSLLGKRKCPFKFESPYLQCDPLRHQIEEYGFYEA